MDKILVVLDGQPYSLRQTYGWAYEPCTVWESICSELANKANSACHPFWVGN